MGQLRSLFPCVIAALRDLGLQINVSKSKILGWSLPSALPPCLEGIQVESCVQFLGVPLAIIEADAGSIAFWGRPLWPFFRSFVFNALVTSTVRWAIGTLVPTAQNTPGPDAMCNFVGVGLTFANSPSWSSAEQFGPSGILPSFGDDVGGVLCGMYYFCSNIGTLLGTCCRRPRPCLVLCHRKKFTPRLFDMACAGIALGLITPAFLGCTVFCAIMDLGVALAADRKLWDQWRDMWLFAFQVQHQTIGHNIYCVKESQMAWHVRCWQECALVVRQSLLDMVRPQLLASTCIYKFVVWTLDRVDGWQGVHVQCSASCTFDDVVGLFLGVSGFFY